MEERIRIFDVDRAISMNIRNVTSQSPVSSTFWIFVSFFLSFFLFKFEALDFHSRSPQSLHKGKSPGGLLKARETAKCEVDYVDRVTRSLKFQATRIFPQSTTRPVYEETRIEMFVVVSHDFGIGVWFGSREGNRPLFNFFRSHVMAGKNRVIACRWTFPSEQHCTRSSRTLISILFFLSEVYRPLWSIYP